MSGAEQFEEQKIRRIISQMEREFGDTKCEMVAQPWVRTRAASWIGYPKIPAPYPLVPVDGPCAALATRKVNLRLCPCQVDLRTLPKHLLDPAFGGNVYAGLAVLGVSLCDAHLSYFVEYLHYPMVCPGCGVAFQDAGEIIMSSRPLPDDI